jgi:hypothetical protein
MDLEEIECESVYWIYLAECGVHWRAVVNAAVSHLALKKTGNFLKGSNNSLVCGVTGNEYCPMTTKQEKFSDLQQRNGD